MSKLETQINQIFLIPKDSKKVSLILFEEKLNANTHLFVLAELRNIQKKTEANDLGKIAEIIIESFKLNKKMSSEMIFEATLPDINNKLTDFAHKGRKSWLGKFSGLVALKSDRDFYLANTGHTSAWLKRKKGLNEIVGPDKTETHPLKTFSNFSSGRLADGDNLVLTTSSIFNYISLELFSKTLNSYELEEACPRITDVLRASAKSEEGFAVFMLAMSKKAPAPVITTEEQPAEQIVEEERNIEQIISQAPYADKPTNTEKTSPVVLPIVNKYSDGLSAGKPSKSKTPVKAAKTAAPVTTIPINPIYAPMPEDLVEEKSNKPAWTMPAIPRLSKFSFKIPKFTGFKFNLHFPKLNILPNVSGPAKFFLASFILFIVLFGLNIAAYSVRKSNSEEEERFNTTAETFVTYLDDAESALLYKNQNEALSLMSSAQTELHKLEQLDPEKIGPFRAKFEEMDNKISRVTIIRNLTPVYEAPYPINYLAKAGSGYLVSNQNPNSIGMFEANTLKNIFLLNSTDGELRGVAHVSGQGNFVVTKDKIYLANANAQEFEQMAYSSNADLLGLKFVNPNRLYTINKDSNQVVRYTASSSSVSGATNVLKSSPSLQGVKDFGVDNDIFLLYSDRVEKYTSTGQPASFQLGPLAEKAQQMTKIRVANQLYILEPVANRILIYSRTGELMNQIKFPELSDMKDIFIDEGARELMIVNGSKIYKITF